MTVPTVSAKSSTSTIPDDSATAVVPAAAMRDSSFACRDGPTELHVHADTMSNAPRPVFQPIRSPRRHAANAVPQMGSVDRMMVDSAADTFFIATVSPNTVSEVVTSPVHKSETGTARFPDDGSTVSRSDSSDSGRSPAWTHHPTASTATARSCAATRPKISSGYLREQRSVSQNPRPKLLLWERVE